MSTVLIVDDSPADRALFTALLGGDEFDVHEATGAAATPFNVRGKHVRIWSCSP